MKLVITGDSITANLGVSTPANGYASKVAAGLGLSASDWINTAVSGYTSNLLLTNIQSQVLQYQPQYCMMMLGVNDVIQDQLSGASPYTAAISYISNINGIHAALINANIKPIYISAIPTLIPGLQIRSKMLSDILQDFSIERDAAFFNLNASFLYFSNQKPDSVFRSWYADNLYHPNDTGHQIMADQILKNVIKFN